MKKFGVLLFVILMLLFCAACDKNDGDDVPNLDSETNQEDFQGVPDEPDEDVGDIVYEEVMTADDGTEILKVSCVLPKLDETLYPNAAAIVNNYYESQMDRYKEYAATELVLYAESVYVDMNLQGQSFSPMLGREYYEVTYCGNGVISFVRYIEDGSGATADVAVISEVFSLENGSLITSASLFSAEEEIFTEVITKEIKEQIKKAIDESVELSEYYYEAYPLLVEERFMKDSFYLTEEGIAFYYQLYELGEYELGIPKFVVPYELVADIFMLW